MDALKTGEVKRMELGGNGPWKTFFNAHSTNALNPGAFDACTIAERYDSEAGEEWKERLTAKVEGTDYVPGTSKRAPKKATVEDSSSPAASGRNTPLSRIQSPPQRTSSPSQKERNEAYFARMGNANATRSADLPPNQGGKYSGFGSGPAPSANNNGGWQDDFQQDPLSSITKGLGWLGSTVSKQAISVNRSYIQPGVKQLQEGDFAAQAQRNLQVFGSQAQQGVKGLGEQFNKFVDPEHTGHGGGARGSEAPEKADFWDSFGQAPAGPPKEKKGFWDEFASAGEQAQQAGKGRPESIGTAALRPGGGGGGGAGGSGSGGAGKRDEGDGWGDW